MSTIHETTLPIVIDIEGYQKELDINVTYTYYKGKPATQVEPAEDACAEIMTAAWDGIGIAALFDAVDKEIWKELEQRIVDEIE